MADQFFPWRYLVSEHLHAGQLPLWNPYQNGGYPMHGDPQSAAWYPIVWMLSFLTGGYSIYTLHIEFILTLYIASVAFYKLSKHFDYSTHTSILLAYTYCCSGFFIGNAQHFTWIISGAFLPFVFLYFLKTLQSPNLNSSFKTALALFFILSGGYPAFLIIVSYILLALLLIKIVALLKQKKYAQLYKLLSHQAYIAIAFLMCSAVIIYSIIYCKPFITRGESVTAAAALFMPFSLPSFLSFLFPFSTCHHSDIIHTDISMANAYMGIAGLVFFIVFLFRRNKTALQKSFLTIGIITLAASVGSALPVRIILYEYLPLMNLFRFPSAFRIFFIISFLLLGGSELDKIIGKQVLYSNLKYIYAGLLFMLIACLCLAKLKNYSSVGIYDYLFNTAFFNEHCTVYDHIIIQALVHLIVLSTALILWLKYRKHPTSLKWILTAFIITDVFIALNMNMKYTAVNEYSKPDDIAVMLNKTPKGFPIPTKRIIENNDNIQTLKPFWKNLNIFQKEIAYDGYNPFFLIDYETLETSPLYKISQENFLVYLSTEILNIEDKIDTNTTSSTKIYLPLADYKKYRSDTINSTNDRINITLFTGNSITLKTNTFSNRVAVIYQNYMPGWNAYINNTKTPIIKANYALIGIPIPKGENTIVLKYQPPYIFLFFFLSVCSFLVLFIFIFLEKQLKKQ